MKLEDLKTDDDLNSLIAKATETAVAEAKTGLVNKNQELLDELKRFKGVDLESLTASQKELQDLKQKTAEENNDYKTLVEQIKEQTAKQIDDLTKKNESIEGEFKNTLVNGALASELGKANIKPSLLDVAVHHLASRVSVITEDGKRIAKVGDMAIPDFIADWAKSDEGKEFVLAGGNSGGGAGGGGDAPDGDASYEKFFHGATKNITKQTELYRKNPKLYDAFKKQYASA